MKGITKPKVIGIAAAGLLAALLIAAVIAPAMGTHGDSADDKIDKLVHDLENAIASYNEAVTGDCSDEDIAHYMNNVDQVLTELEALGMEAEFTTISENRGMVTVDVNVAAADERTQTHRHAPEEMNKHRYATKMNWPDRPDPLSEVEGHSTGVAKAFKSSFESTGLLPILVS
jgi:hypothetical protein